MLINVAQQLKGPIGSVRSYDVDEVVEVPDFGNILVRGKVELLRTHRGILAQGKLQAEIELSCSRCLTPFKCPMTLNIEDEFLPTIDIVTGASLEVPEDGNFFTIDERHTLDLTEAVRQYIVMTVPMKPLCRKDCAGLCVECGQNLNLGTCCCKARELKPGAA
ncbi:MAG: DUF177 domain-containing protein [Chloroflexi bacterium]|nr:DUF177 domain-containing protein [Chloroflexota bacterium]